MYHGQIIKAGNIEDQQKQILTSLEEQQNFQEDHDVQQEIPQIKQPEETKAVILTLEKASEQAREIRKNAIAKANIEGEQIVNEARERAEFIALEKAVELSNLFRAEMSVIEPIMGNIISDCVKKIIGEMPTRDVNRGILKTALSEFSQHRVLSVKISPKDYDEEWWENWVWARDNNLDVSMFERDSSIEEGRAIVSFAGREIDIGLKTQIAALQKAVTLRINGELENIITDDSEQQEG